MKNKPQISIIMPTYNRGHIIEQAIDSVQRQDFMDWELIIVDDGSKDGTQDLVTDIVSRENRIRYVPLEQNGGVSVARNHGITQSKGQYIAYLDSDNYMYADWLSCMLSYFENNPTVSWLYPKLNTTIIDAVDLENEYALSESIVPDKQYSVQDLWSMKFQADPNGLVHERALLADSVKWDTTITSYGDYEYALQLSKMDPDGFAIHPFALGRYIRVYGTGGMCSSRGYKEIISGLVHIKNKHRGFNNLQKYTDIDERIQRYTECLNLDMSPIEGLRQKFGKTKS